MNLSSRGALRVRARLRVQRRKKRVKREDREKGAVLSTPNILFWSESPTQIWPIKMASLIVPLPSTSNRSCSKANPGSLCTVSALEVLVRCGDLTCGQRRPRAPQRSVWTTSSSILWRVYLVCTRSSLVVLNNNSEGYKQVLCTDPLSTS